MKVVDGVRQGHLRPGRPARVDLDDGGAHGRPGPAARRGADASTSSAPRRVRWTRRSSPARCRSRSTRPAREDVPVATEIVTQGQPVDDRRSRVHLRSRAPVHRADRGPGPGCDLRLARARSSSSGASPSSSSSRVVGPGRSSAAGPMAAPSSTSGRSSATTSGSKPSSGASATEIELALAGPAQPEGRDG